MMVKPHFYQATADFTGSDEDSTMSFEKGDFLLVTDKKDGWLLALFNGLVGWVPETRLTQFEESIAEKEKFRPPVPVKLNSMPVISRNSNSSAKPPIPIPGLKSSGTLVLPKLGPQCGDSVPAPISPTETGGTENSNSPPPLPTKSPSHFTPPTSIPAIPPRADKGEVASPV